MYKQTGLDIVNDVRWQFLLRQTFHPSGKLLKQKIKLFKKNYRKSLKLNRLTGLFLPKVKKARVKEDSQTIQTEKKTLKQDKIQRRLRLGQLPWRDLDQSHLERTRSNLFSCLQVVQCAQGSQLLWAVTWAGVGICDAAVCESFLLL